MVVGGHKLDVPFASPRELLAAMKIVSQVLSAYYKS
jgi:hypothetical protein